MKQEKQTIERLSRRKVLFGLAAAGAGAAVTGMAAPGMAKAMDDPGLTAQLERLRNVLGHVEIADDVIIGAAARWIAPPDPDRPAFETLLTTIDTECQSVIDTVRELLLRRGA